MESKPRTPSSKPSSARSRDARESPGGNRPPRPSSARSTPSKKPSNENPTFRNSAELRQLRSGGNETLTRKQNVPRTSTALKESVPVLDGRSRGWSNQNNFAPTKAQEEGSPQWVRRRMQPLAMESPRASTESIKLKAVSPQSVGRPPSEASSPPKWVQRASHGPFSAVGDSVADSSACDWVGESIDTAGEVDSVHSSPQISPVKQTFTSPVVAPSLAARTGPANARSPFIRGMWSREAQDEFSFAFDQAEAAAARTSTANDARMNIPSPTKQHKKAAVIQKWWRTHHPAPVSVKDNNVRDMLRQKLRNRSSTNGDDALDSLSAQHRKERQEKARLARQDAIRVLKEHRAEKDERARQKRQTQERGQESDVSQPRHDVPADTPNVGLGKGFGLKLAVQSVDSPHSPFKSRDSVLDKDVQSPIRSDAASPQRPTSNSQRPLSYGPTSNGRPPGDLSNRGLGGRADVPSDRPSGQVGPAGQVDLPAGQGDRRSLRTSQEKMANILQFLEEVDQTQDTPLQDSVVDDIPMTSRSGYSDLSAISRPSTSVSMQSKPPVLATQIYDEVKSRMAALKLELDHRNKTVDKLKAALEEEKKKTEGLNADWLERHNTQMAQQKNEYENAIQRQLTFVDRLLADKNDLSSKCEQLASEIKSFDRKFQDKLREKEEQFERELKKQKDAWAAAEKIRRDTWAQQQTRAIKDDTVRGLQPEIERMLAKHKADLRRLEEKHAEDMRHVKDQMGAETDQQMAELRQRLLREKDIAVEKERETSLNRLSEVNERHDSQLQAMRTKWQHEADAERDRLESLRRQDKNRLEDALSKLQQVEARKVADVRQERVNVEEEFSRRHSAELNSLKEKHKIEMEQWQSEMTAKMAQELKKKEKELKEKVQRDRDEEIEVIIQKLEQESKTVMVTAQREADAKLEVLVEQHKLNMKEARDSERQWMEKYMDICKNQGTADERHRAMQARVLELEQEVQKKDKDAARAEAAAARARQELERKEEALRTQMKKQTDALHAEKLRLEADVRDLNATVAAAARNKEDAVAAMKKEKNDELDQLGSRVRQTISKKDDTIAALKDQVASAEARVLQYEQLLERQRQEMLA